MGESLTAQNTTDDRVGKEVQCASVSTSWLAAKFISIPWAMIRSSIYYTFLNETTKSGHFSSSGIHGVQKYYKINKLKKYIPGINCSLLVRCEVLYLPPSKWKLVNISCCCSTYDWRSRKHCGHGNETMRSLCIVYVLLLLTILKASPKTYNNALTFTGLCIVNVFFQV
jgi:hypothetical protein